LGQRLVTGWMNPNAYAVKSGWEGIWVSDQAKQRVWSALREVQQDAAISE